MQVSAQNSLYVSKKSEPYKFTYDGETNVVSIKDLSVTNENEDNITISWKYDEDADGYNVQTSAERPYPELPPNVTNTKNITLTLAPGANYRITVSTFQCINGNKNL